MRYRNIGKRVKRLRKGLGLTLVELANLTDSTKSYIWKIENTTDTRISAQLAYNLSIALDVTLEFLIGETICVDSDVVFLRKYNKLNLESKRLLDKIIGVLE